jgi:hypothetical protein
MIELGREVKEIITGFVGIATARCKYLTGCVHIEVTPQKLKKDGETLDSRWIDESRLKHTSSRKKIKLSTRDPKEGPSCSSKPRSSIT